jgi:hypothetical protein
VPTLNSGSRCDATEAIRLLLPARITVFAVDLSGSGLSEGEYVTLGAREVLDVAGLALALTLFCAIGQITN